VGESKNATVVRINVYKHHRQTIQVSSLAILLHEWMTQKVSCDIKKFTAVRLQVIINVILALLFILISFSIYCHTNMKSFRKLNYWLLMKQLLFHCRQWSLCLAHIWSSSLPLLMGMAGVCFWWNFPYIITFFSEELFSLPFPSRVKFNVSNSFLKSLLLMWLD